MSYGYGNYFGWAPRKSVTQRRAEAARKVRDAARAGKPLTPVVIEGRKIAQTFWGKAWCDNLERYRDFAHRLERGRSYVRSGSVIDLRLAAGEITATVSGSELYEIAIQIDAVEPTAWRAIQRDCAGNIGSLLELLGGKLSEPVMARLCADRTGLFPAPSSIRFTCSCPDYAIMCKHVAAVMYGVGARLDRAPELLFTLRRVSADDLLTSVMTELPGTRAPSPARTIATDGLAALFGIELVEPTLSTPAPVTSPSKSRAARRGAGSKATRATTDSPPTRAPRARAAATERTVAQAPRSTAATVTRRAAQAAVPTARVTRRAAQAAVPTAKVTRRAAQAPAPAAKVRHRAAQTLPAPANVLAQPPVPAAKMMRRAAPAPVPAAKVTRRAAQALPAAARVTLRAAQAAVPAAKVTRRAAPAAVAAAKVTRRPRRLRRRAAPR